MKNKVINLNAKPQIVQNKGVKYSALLEKFIEPFECDFADVAYNEDIFEFSINAWNLGNMKSILPQGESDQALNYLEDEEINMDLLKRMIDYKVSHFKEYTNFISDFEFKGTIEEPILSVVSQDQESFLANIARKREFQNTNSDFEENFVDRTALTIKPLQPFWDWCSNLYPEEPIEHKETMTFLINEEIEDVEAWLKKKFDKIFVFELEAWHLNKKEWPQKRNYKMFQQWFQVDISTMVYDFETNPVTKSE